MKKNATPLRVLMAAALLGGSVLTLGASPAAAFEQQGVKEGNTTVSVFGTVNNSSPDEGDSVTLAMVGGALGTMTSDTFGVELGFTYMGVNSGDDTMQMLMLRPAIRYYFVDNPTMVPYVGAHVNWGTINLSDEDDNINMYGGGASAGANFFITETVAIYPELQIERIVVDMGDDDDTAGATSTSLLFGLRAFF